MMTAIPTLLLCFLSLNHVSAQATQKQIRDFEVHKRQDCDTQTNCNLFSGKWVHDPSYPLYEPSECPYVSKEFDCKANGRPDSGYQEWRWQPNGCDVPRFSARRLLEKLKGKKVAFVGDSITQNQFQSLVCLVYKEFPTTFVPTSHLNNKFISTEYDFSIEFFWSPFLVDLEITNEMKVILHVDEIQNNSVHWTADILVFESSKWWPEVLGRQRWDIAMEGQKNYTDMKPLVAYKKALTTWSQWVSSNVNPQTLVFFRSNSYSHYNRKRRCASEKKPIQDPSYNPHPTVYSAILQQVLSTTKFPVKFLNTSLNSALRKDGHPSMYTNLNNIGPEHQDCTHWCLPGIPDSWNQLLYATLLGA
ncbi:protein trichome birefringence-like 43 [Cryptomeria japonica]|uniref:protein trichome birefringence-like 43 n=1 Tax=Cryptomeria japonica TaxID=3369 RepID=UPI0025ABD269|nr:protein trichome birefringence-like 43 [Cryptomeria japonica]